MEGGVRVRALGIAPIVVGQPSESVNRLMASLTETCGPTLGWITSAPLCDSLAADLDRASSAIARAGWKEARAALGSFIGRLEATHDSTGLGAVNGNAYYLLSINAAFVRDALPDPPTSVPGGPYASAEGGARTLDGTASRDPKGGALTYAWAFGDGTAGSGASVSHAWADNGTYPARLIVTNPSGLADTASTTVTVSNVAPTLTSLSGPVDPVPVGTPVTVRASFADPGTLDTHSASVAWGDGSATPATVTQGPGSGTLEATHTYASAGVYSAPVMVMDDDGGVATDVFQYAVVYDPSGGFVTGGGWIESPVGAYTPNPAAPGRASFGFVSRYRPGANQPEGETQFRMRSAELTFHSEAYDWLVVAGARAQFKGVGALNGQSGYGFMLTAVDGEEPGGGGVDRFRIKIWTLAGDAVVYDNQRGATDDAQPATALGGGQIQIHRE